MRAIVTILALVLATTTSLTVAVAAPGDAVQREAYEIGEDYVFESQTPECADLHVVCFALTGAETSVTFSVQDFATVATEGLAPPVAAHVMMFGPSGFTMGWLCGEGTIDIVSPRTSARLELALGGAGPCDWTDSEHAAANVASAPATRGEVIMKTRVEAPEGAAGVAANVAPPGCIADVVCPFLGTDPSFLGAGVEVYAPDGATSVGAQVLRGEGFFGPFVIADVHGTAAGNGWHAGAGASDYDFDNVPDSTCVCAGVWDQGGYVQSFGVGTWDWTGDGPSVDDTFGYLGLRYDGSLQGVTYGWNANGEPYVGVYTPLP